jgi:ferric-dicitrate binding protein FerR (iron transport regulator)
MDQNLRFVKENLPRIVAELNIQYDSKIELQALNSDQLFTGNLPMNNLAEALEIICATYHLEQRKTDDTIILVPVDAEN